MTTTHDSRKKFFSVNASSAAANTKWSITSCNTIILFYSVFQLKSKQESSAVDVVIVAVVIVVAVVDSNSSSK